MTASSENLAINPWVVAISVMLGTFMEVLDTTVINVALPHIAGNLSATYDESTWVLTSYLVSNAIILPMTGWLARTFGRKRLLMTAVGGFTLSSLACGLAPNLPLLIFFRVLQGATGGGLQPLSQAIMLEAFPPKKRGQAMAFFALGIVVAPMLGPVVGGWLTDSFSWRWVFFINLPIGLASLFLINQNLFDPPYLKKKLNETVDYWGMMFLILGIGALQIFLDKGQQEDWLSSNYIRGLAVISAVALVSFVVRELRIEHPILDLRVLHHRSYTTGLLMMTVLGFALYGSMVLLPLWLQTLMGYSAYDAGIATLPRGMGSFLFMPIIGMLMTKVDPRKLLVVGLTVSGLTMIWLGSINLQVGFWQIAWPQILQGASMGMLFVPLNTISNDSISKEKLGNATSLFNLMRNIGGSVGIAMVTTIYARRTQANTRTFGANINEYNTVAQQYLSGVKAALVQAGADPVTAARQAYNVAFLTLQREAAMLSFVKCFRLLGILFLLMIPMVAMMKQLRHLRKPGEAGSTAEEAGAEAAILD
jgi:DHA2 family multidrug resistance protein